MSDEEEIRVVQISAQQLKAMLDSATRPFVLDVREPWETAQGMIPGAKHIPMNSIPVRAVELPRDETVVVYCAIGERSYAVAAYLVQLGFADARNLEGGIMAWTQLASKEV